MKPISPALAHVLRSGRAEFNARFAAARHVYPQLDPAAFTSLLHTAVDALAQATERVRADRVSEVVMAAYDAALELAGQNLAGPGARQPFVEEAWLRILPPAAALVATDPTGVIAAVCNAAHQIASTPGARPAQWIDAMATLAPQCPDAPTLLKVGQVAAWRAGLAHYRNSALATADTLPEVLALAAVSAPPEAGWRAVREKLRGNPWHDPQDAPERSGARIAAHVGAFRGWGGLFVEPPRLAAVGTDFLVRSVDDCWLLMADCYGATFHRATLTEFEAAQRASKRPPALKLEGPRVVWNGQALEIGDLGELTSVAANETTLALTGGLTHSIVLVAIA